jgi:hypothetical protein
MVSKRLFELLREISASEAKEILWICSQHKDKRLKILEALVKGRHLVYENFLLLFKEKCKKFYRNRESEQILHTIRRLTDYFCNRIEKVLFEGSENAEMARSIGLGNLYKKRGNFYLSSYYFERAYKLLIVNGSKDDLLRLLPNLISLEYLKGTKASYRRGLQFNEILNKTMDVQFHKVKVDYYNNISNLYLDNNTIGEKSNSQLLEEINFYVGQVDDSDLIIGYRISQMRLSFGTDEFEKFSKLTETYFSQIEDLVKVEVLYRKYLYLKLVLGFYSGASISDLLFTADRINAINKNADFVDNYTVFYLVILLLLKGERELAKATLGEKSLCFKHNASYLKMFINAVMLFDESEYVKAKKLFVQLLQIEDYFVEQFSRLFLIVVYAKTSDWPSFYSMVRATERQVKSNPERKIINQSTLIFLGLIKQLVRKRIKEIILPANASCLHTYLLYRIL